MRTPPARETSAALLILLSPLTACKENRPSVCDVLIQHESFVATAVDASANTALGVSIVFQLDGAPEAEAVCAWRVATADCVEWISGSEATGHYLVTASGAGFTDSTLEADVASDASGETETIELDFQLVPQ